VVTNRMPWQSRSLQAPLQLARIADPQRVTL
jgi:hypothetical protein